MSESVRVAVYAGTFDPPTNGHLEIIARAARLFGAVVVAVYQSPNKQTLFASDERLALVRDAVAEARLENVRVREYDDLTVRVAREEGAVVLIRGIRSVSDFDYEFQMSHMNHQLAPDIETLAILASAEYSFLSSTLVREVAKLGQIVDKLVPRVVAERLRERFGKG
ncbi:MAG TPA: pantetheine-phosphate adenylyltransferase [Chloroflexota bacterium]|nr:pantetheine-phosphate adenylyltransferase [Chloroflexota bacterium]